MNQSFTFCHQRAEDAAAEALRATLDLVRERALRSEKTWRGLAAQAKKIEDDRVLASAERALRREEMLPEAGLIETA